jgi:hypothetical protein
MHNPKRSRQSGSTIMELAIVLPFISLTFLGTTGLGIMLGRYVQVAQVTRDIGHMYSDGVDFTQSVPRNIVTQKLALGTGMTDTGGNGVIMLSKVTTVYQQDCTASGYNASQCANANLVVFTNRITIGKATLRASAFGTPDSSILDSEGNISNSIYMQNTNSSVRTTDFETLYDDAVQRATGSAPSPPAMPQGQVLYVVEGYFQYPDITFLGWETGGGAYKRYIFR